jgi:hypothetical protein
MSYELHSHFVMQPDPFVLYGLVLVLMRHAFAHKLQEAFADTL